MNQDSAPESVPDPSSNLPPQASGEASPSSKPVGLATLFAGVVLPLICFAISYPDRPDWQSGQPTAYAQLLLAHKESAPLYPFLLYCMTSMVLLFANPARFRENAWVRFGIFSGVLVAAEYWVLFQVAFGIPMIWQVLGSCWRHFCRGEPGSSWDCCSGRTVYGFLGAQTCSCSLLQ